MNRTRVAAHVCTIDLARFRWIVAACVVTCMFTVADTASAAAPSYNIVPLGFDDLEHTRNDGYRRSAGAGSSPLNEAGQITGVSERYNGDSTNLGQIAWLYNGATTIHIGLSGAEHTSDSGIRSSSPEHLNESGQVIGYSRRFNGGFTDLGRSAWMYDGATTIDIGLTGSEHTRNDGKFSSPSQSGGQMAYLITPLVLEPSAMVLGLSAICCVGWIRSRRRSVFELGCGRRRTIMAAWLVACFVVAPLVASAASVRTVAWSGQQAPGTAEGVVFELVRPFQPSGASLNSSGQVAFFAALAGDGVDETNDIGVWTEGSGGLELVARLGDAAPGIEGATLASFWPDRTGYSVPTVEFSDSGDIAFGAQLAGAGVDATNDQAFWAGRSGSLSLIARSGVALSGLPDGYESVSLIRGSHGPPVLNSVGEAAFIARFVGDGVPFVTGLWSENSGLLEFIAGPAAQAPGFPPGASLGGRVSGLRQAELLHPSFNSAGQTAFAASVFASPDSQTRVGGGIFLAENGTLRAVLREGDPVLGLPDGVSFRVRRVDIELELNSVGQVAFVSGAGIISNGSGVPALVARTGNQAPGAPPGVVFQNLLGDWLTFNSAGQTAFVAQLGGVGVDESSDMSFWSEGFGGLHLVAREGAIAPGTSEGTYFGTLNDFHEESFAQNSAGQLAFTAVLSGPDVDATNLGGLWAEDRTGNLRLVIRYGDQLEVAPGEFRTVNGLSLLTYIEEEGLTSYRRNGTGFNDRGQLAFWASFADGSNGYFVSDAVAVPEPSSLAFVGIALGVATGVMCRQRRLFACWAVVRLRQRCGWPRLSHLAAGEFTQPVECGGSRRLADQLWHGFVSCNERRRA